MIEAISHLVHRDYEAIVADFVTLEFIPAGLTSPAAFGPGRALRKACLAGHCTRARTACCSACRLCSLPASAAFLPHGSCAPVPTSPTHPPGTDLAPILPVLAKVRC